MTPTQHDLQAIFAAVVQRLFASGEWRFVAVSPVATLSASLRLGLQATFGGPLRGGVLVVIERLPDGDDTQELVSV